MSGTESTPSPSVGQPASSLSSVDDSRLGELAHSFEEALRPVVEHFVQSFPLHAKPDHLIAAAHASVLRLIESHFNAEQSAAARTELTRSQSGSELPQPKKKPTRGYIDGCFDIMHSGHYNAIRQAKQLCDILVVGVHSDAEIMKHKGPPVMNEKERLATVESCKWVDEIAFDTPYDPSLELLDRLNCDFAIHGDDMSTTADGKDAYASVKEAGRMKIVKRTEGISTTDLVGRLLLMTKQHHLVSPAITGKSGANVSGNQSPSLSSTMPDLNLGKSAAPGSAEKSRSSGSGPSSSSSSSAPEHYARSISNFLPTTWRISQFSNHRNPSATDKIVYIDGAFDLFHVGHIETLKKAKELGTFLYVGVHDDATVNAHKGKNYPIMNLHERVLNVLSCKYVDECVIGAPWIVTKDLLTTLNISIVVSGSSTKMDYDYEKQASSGSSATASMVDPYAAVKAAGKYVEIDSSSSLSTNDVITRIIENRLKYENRNANRSKKELNYLTGQKEYVEEK